MKWMLLIIWTLVLLLFQESVWSALLLVVFLMWLTAELWWQRREW